MPFMFEPIDDYTELLMPDDLLGEGGILNGFLENMSDADCADVEIVGWLYQFYMSEKKDEVMARKKAVPKEDIPAVTQLFTPHWIVRYLVENSLGRLWMLNHPDSRLTERMEYYIAPEEPETDFLRIDSPEKIKVCDPACGSGHMLTYAFDLLYAIYEEQGYNTSEIPEKILNNNLYGIEIDERAGELAAFALSMKARERYRRFFRKPVQPHICVLENIQFVDDELSNYMTEVGRDLFTGPLHDTLLQFEGGDSSGSLIVPKAQTVSEIMHLLDERDLRGNLLLHGTHKKVLMALSMADYLSSKYHVVVANPPYMGSAGMNPQLTKWAKAEYPGCWHRGNSDLYAMFIERCLRLCHGKGLVAMITMQTWMFLSSFEELRSRILTRNTVVSMAHLGPRAFDSIGGEVVSTSAFVLGNTCDSAYEGCFIRLVDGGSEAEKDAALVEAIVESSSSLRFKASSVDFRKLPGFPIAYWLSDSLLSIFETVEPLTEKATPRQGLATSDNNRFVRSWSEVSFARIGFDCVDRDAARASGCRWFPFNKGGAFRRWSGNTTLVVNWEDDGAAIKDSILTKYPYLNGNPDFVAKNPRYYFKPGLTWSALSSGLFSIRLQDAGFIFADKGQAMFPHSAEDMLPLEGLLNSKVVVEFLKALSPTLDFNVGYIAKIPCRLKSSPGVERLNRGFASDWDSFETSWGFASHPLISARAEHGQLQDAYDELVIQWQELTLEMRGLEEDNNRLFIDAYGLQDELTPDVPFSEITLTCNAAYRYGAGKSEQEYAQLLLADTIKDFISYAVGCMLGRYSLDEPGLIIANQGETLQDYMNRVPKPSFIPDEDNVLPVLEGEYFTDDVVGRFRNFLRVAFGEDHYGENLALVEGALGKSIRKYFLSDFYTHHLRTYKKRPIYWLFSSPKKSFNVLIYMHRYESDTVSLILNDYLREFVEKLKAHRVNQEEISISESARASERSKATKEMGRIDKILTELDDYERNILYPLAAKKIEIDLDDGVKVNYNKFGDALRKAPGLSGK